MLATKQVTIGNHTYELTRLLSTDGIDAAAKLGGAIAPALEGLEGLGSKLGIETVVKAIRPLFTNPTLGPTLKELSATFAKSTQLVGDKGKKVPLTELFDVHFSDKYDDWMFWLGHSIWFSLESFLRGARVLGELLAAMIPKSDSPGQS